MAVGTQQGFPDVSSTLVGPSGHIRQAWLQLLIQLWNRTGGSPGTSTTDIITQQILTPAGITISPKIGDETQLALALRPPLGSSSTYPSSAFLQTQNNLSDILSYSTARQNLGVLLTNNLGGLTLSTSGGTNVFGVSAGQAADSTNLHLLTLPSAFTKTTATWAAGTGNGALDTGTATIGTWYHAFIIQRPDTGQEDILISLSATSPTLPTNYTLFRRIGAMLTNGLGNWVRFFQFGNLFIWQNPVGDINGVTGNATAALVSLTVPPGVNVIASGKILMSNTTGGAADILFYSPTVATQAAGTPVGNVSVYAFTNGTFSGVENILTNTSSQISLVASATSANITTYWSTTGWTDFRGQI